MVTHKTNYNNSAMVNDRAINYQKIPLDYLDKPINIPFSLLSPLNSLVTKHKASFTANDSHV